jgi:predicted ATPase
MTLYTIVFCGNYAAANRQSNEVTSLADEKGAPLWKAYGIMFEGFLLAVAGQASNAIPMITTGITYYRSTGSTAFLPWYLSNLAMAYADVGQFDDAWSYIDQAMITAERTKERWCDAEVQRVAGEIVLKSPQPDAAKAEGSFERALAVAREQQAKSWELRAAMSMARLWRDQGKRQQAHDLLAPVYSWFTEGFDTIDLQEAKALLDQLAR